MCDVKYTKSHRKLKALLKIRVCCYLYPGIVLSTNILGFAPFLKEGVRKPTSKQSEAVLSSIGQTRNIVLWKIVC